MVGEKYNPNKEIARLRSKNTELEQKVMKLEGELGQAKRCIERFKREKEQYRIIMYKQGREIQNHPFDVMMRILELFESTDEYTEGHSLRVTKYGVMTAKVMGLPAHEIELVHKGGHMHDIGKLQWLKEYFTKKHLTPEERARIRDHTIIGYQYLKTLAKKHKEYKGLAPIAKYHHEHFGGVSVLTHPHSRYPGYPGELSGKNIPLAARIIANGDCFDAMTTDRGYKQKMSIIKSREEMKRSSNLPYNRDIIPNKGPDSQFDPEITEAFLSIKIVGAAKNKIAHVIGCPYLFDIDSLDMVINPSGFDECGCIKNPPKFIQYRKIA